MSDGAVKLTSSKYFLVSLQPYFTGFNEAKGARTDLASGSIREICARNAPIQGISLGIASAGGICVGAKLSSISS